MSESALTLTITQLRDAVCYDVHGTAYSDLSTPDKLRVNTTVDNGLRQFYRPPPAALNGRQTSHSWSFQWLTARLTQVAPYTTGTIAITSGVVTLTGGTWPSAAYSSGYVLRVDNVDHTLASRDSDTQLTLTDLTVDADAGSSYVLHLDDYDLPDDFGWLEGESLTYEPVSAAQPQIRVVDEGSIRSWRQTQTLTAPTYPYCVAIRAKPNATATGTRSQMMFWPNVNRTAYLTYRYFSRPNITAVGATGTEYVPGASDHANTILASVRAAAELDYDGQRGPHWQNFQLNLQASVEADTRQNRPRHLGSMNCSPGVGTGAHRRLPQHWSDSFVTYNP